jgi:L-aminopeptidase/D-esterase-like protein
MELLWNVKERGSELAYLYNVEAELVEAMVEAMVEAVAEAVVEAVAEAVVEAVAEALVYEIEE